MTDFRSVFGAAFGMRLGQVVADTLVSRMASDAYDEAKRSLRNVDWDEAKGSLCDALNRAKDAVNKNLKMATTYGPGEMDSEDSTESVSSGPAKFRPYPLLEQPVEPSNSSLEDSDVPRRRTL